MRFQKILGEMVRDGQRKTFLIEYSQKLINNLVSKFKKEDSSLTDDEILTTIQGFKRIQPALPPRERDIEKYSYGELVQTVEVYEINKKEPEQLLKKLFVKGVDLAALKENIKKFIIIRPFLGQAERERMVSDVTILNGFMQQEFSGRLTKELLEHFSKPEFKGNLLDKTQVLYYVAEFLKLIPKATLDFKPINRMDGSDFEHLVDGLIAKYGVVEQEDVDVSSVNVLRLDNGLVIFSPANKEQCITLSFGRSWCISRSSSTNMYYTYRLNHERTIYIVINENLPYTHVDYAIVVLVDPRGGIAIADKTNSGIYGGGDNRPYRELLEKIPQLNDLPDEGRSLFKPIPLTREEKNVIDRVDRAVVGADVTKTFPTEEEMEIWLDYKSPTLSDDQYRSLPPNIKKKYIGLGFDLSLNMLEGSEPEVIQYYVAKKRKQLETKPPAELTSADTALLMTPMFAKMKEEFRNKLSGHLTTSYAGGQQMKIPELGSGAPGAYLVLYGAEEFFNVLPKTVSEIEIINPKGKYLDGYTFAVPESISEFKDIQWLTFTNCIHSLPKTISKLENVIFMTITGNGKLTRVPDMKDMKNTNITWEGSPIQNLEDLPEGTKWEANNLSALK